MKKVFSEIANRPMLPTNKAMYECAVALELAMLECEELGLEVESVEWTGHFKPVLILRPNIKTKVFAHDGTAILYGTKSDGVKRFDLYQTDIKGVKCKWQAERDTKAAPRNRYAKKYH